MGDEKVVAKLWFSMANDALNASTKATCKRQNEYSIEICIDISENTKMSSVNENGMNLVLGLENAEAFFGRKCANNPLRIQWWISSKCFSYIVFHFWCVACSAHSLRYRQVK